jgi:hypothetical protein
MVIAPSVSSMRRCREGWCTSRRLERVRRPVTMSCQPGRPCVPLDGVPPPAQVAGDGPQAHTLAQQAVDQGMMGPHPFRSTAGRQHGGWPGFPVGGLRAGGLTVRWRYCGAQAVAMRRDALLDGLAEVLEV